VTPGIAVRIDDLLKAHGFRMREAAWNRRVGSLVDVVTLQIDKVGRRATVNVGVLHPVAYTKCWNRPVPDFVEEASCTVHMRLSELIGGRDRWWPLDQPQLEEDVVQKIAAYGLPFFERMHSAHEIESSLARSPIVAKYLRPPQTIYLAVLRHARGDTAGACALLDQFHTKAIGIWKPKAVSLRHEFACQSVKVDDCSS
jgi:hypothetical protein